jgi:pimeloyl-ACP methyl ester carboxylesterase
MLSTMQTAKEINFEAARVKVSLEQVAGIKTVIRTCGEAAREAVVFVHGNPGSGEDFDALLGDVGRFIYAVAPDMPNYGRSQRCSDFPYTVQGYAAHLQALIAHLGIERVHLVLHDFGGPWGLEWAAEHPRAVASVSLFNIGIMPGYRWHMYARIWRMPILGELFMASATRVVFRTLLNLNNPRPLPNSFLTRMYEEADPALKRGALALYRATPDWGALSEQLGERLAPLNLPALVVWGAGDTNLPVSYASQQSPYFSVEEVHVLSECGHWPFIDEPATCSALLQSFLQRQLRAALDAD